MSPLRARPRHRRAVDPRASFTLARAVASARASTCDASTRFTPLNGSTDRAISRDEPPRITVARADSTARRRDRATDATLDATDAM